MNPGSTGTEEHPRILGLETEHVVLYQPDRPFPGAGEEEKRPPFALLQKVLFEGLLRGRKAALSGGMKGGYFLENGGLVHLEQSPTSQEEAPILEVATPECRDPWSVLDFSRAFDEILEETGERSHRALQEHGYQGRILFGKNNVDSRGTGFGCHENYLVYHDPTAVERWILIVSLPFILALFVPPLVLLTLILGAALLGLFLATVLGSAANAVVRAFRAFGRARPRWVRTAQVGYYAFTELIQLPALLASTALLRLVAVRRFEREMTSFLMTRQILTGAGCLNFREGVFELSQRAKLMVHAAHIITRGRKKSVFDLKPFLFAPLSLFGRRRRLSITVGNSNLSDVPNLLKLGTTTLLIEMIERGERFDSLRLVRPLRALRTISREGPWKTVRLRSGQTLTALEIQRAYLRRAREFFRDRPDGRLRHRQILDLWEETLDRLADRPLTLQDTLDWVAKKAILDKAVLSHTNWKVFFAWGKAFDAAGLDAASRARNVADLLRRTSLFRKHRLRSCLKDDLLDPSDFTRHRDLYFQAWKIDLRYHELGSGTGYQRTMEREGLIRKLTDVAQVARATREAPSDTRARIRSYYIRKSPEPDAIQVRWNVVELLYPLRSIPTPDPFAHRLPME